MDNITIVVLGRIGLALLSVAGGICAIFVGKKLYLYGVGLSPDGSKIQTKKGEFNLNLSMKTTGGVVMATSVAWAFMGYLLSPSLEQKRGKDSFIIASGVGNISYASFRENLEQIESKQVALNSNIPLTATELTRAQKDLQVLREAIKDASETIDQSKRLQEDPDVIDKLNTLEQADKAIESNYSEARTFSITRDPDILLKLLPLGQELAIGVIQDADSTKVYRKEEVGEFAQDIEKALKEKTPRRIHKGTMAAGSLDCLGAPEAVCGSLEFENDGDSEGGVSAGIQWHLSPRRTNFDGWLVSLDRRDLAASIKTLAISVCAWYEINAKKSLPFGGFMRGELLNGRFVPVWINQNSTTPPNSGLATGGWRRR